MIKIKNFLLFVVIICLGQVSCCSKTDTLVASSPDGDIQLSFVTDSSGIYYSVSKEDVIIIERSKLGFALSGGDSIVKDLTISNYNSSSVDSEWEQVWGENRVVRNNYNQISIELTESTELKRQLNITFRIYNDGLGFRYQFPEQTNLSSFKIMDELTEFSLTSDFDLWSIPAYQDDRYEYLYSKRKLSEVNDTVHTPLTMVKDGLAISIHEANLTDYASTTLYRTKDKTLKSDLVPWSDGTKVYAQTPFNTPWRTVQIGDKATDLIESNLIINLNEPCKIEDTSWIKPAKYIGIWWGMHVNKYSWSSGDNHGATTKNVMDYIDFAAANNIQGVLVEGWNIGWDGEWYKNGDLFNFSTPYPDFDIQKLGEYAKKMGVGIIGHHETGAAVTNYENQLEDAFNLYNKHSIDYIKTGYVSPKADRKEWHHGQFMVRHYRKVLESAAKHKIMLDVHEPIKPTGIRRTYPNMMTREGARGMEFNAWSPDGGNPPNHEVTLAFTRLLAGPMDYTPGIFNISIPQNPNNQVNTTLAKQLALYITLYSPLQMAADLIENYKDQPAFQFIREVAVDWESSKVLNGEIGEYITVARKVRGSEDWFLGAITNQESRTIDIDLSFLEDGITYIATIYADGEGANYKTAPLKIKITNKALSSKDKISMKLATSGGQAIYFKRIK